MDAASQALLAGVNPELQRRFRIAVAGANARGVDVQVHSGFRSYSQQVALWNARASNPNPVAAPGTSPHEFGWAIDATPIPRTDAAWQVLWDEARKAGLALGEDFSTRKDPPHFELPGFQHGAANQLPSSIPDFGGSMITIGSTQLSLPQAAVILFGVLLVTRLLFR